MGVFSTHFVPLISILASKIIEEWKIKIINFKTSDFCKLLRLPVSPILKIQSFPLGMLILMQKIFLILYPPFEKSTTRIAITRITGWKGMWKDKFPSYCHATVLERQKETKWSRPKPIIVTAGAMVKGVIYLSMIPMMPNQPITTWNNEATIIAPCI